MYSINYYVPTDQGRSKMINYGQYQKQGPGHMNFYTTSPQVPKEDDSALSPKNKKLSELLTDWALTVLHIDTNDEELNSAGKQVSRSLDYLI